MNAVALMYHDVTARGGEDTSGFPGGDAARYKLTLEDFAGHLRAIRGRAHRRPVTVETMAVDRRPSDRRLLLTFDDGGASAAAIADCLEVFGWRGHFFVTTNFIDRPGFLTRAGIRGLRTRGHVVGSHSCSHPLRMARCSPSRLRDEWRQSVDALSDLLGEQISVGSVPGGDHSATVADAAAEAGIRVLFISRPTARVRQHGDMRIFGRFAIRSSTTPHVAAAVAAGDWTPRLKQLVWWDLKAAGKAVASSTYQKIRARRLGASPDLQWGDQRPDASEDPS